MFLRCTTDHRILNGNNCDADIAQCRNYGILLSQIFQKFRENNIELKNQNAN